MSTRVTRRSTATKAAISHFDTENQISEPKSGKKPPRKTSNSKRAVNVPNDKVKARKSSPKPERKSATKNVKKEAGNGLKRKHEEETGSEDEYEELPHNMGRIVKARTSEIKQEDGSAEAGPLPDSAATSAPTMKAEREPSNEDGAALAGSDEPPKKKTKANSKDKAQGKVTTPKQSKTTAKSTPKSHEKRTKAPKTNEYGLTPGISPFPRYERPTAEECRNVADILRAHHSDCKSRPKTIPPPSQIVAGCGEVPSILDALIRTLLSAATTGKNSSSAYQGMVARYGNRKTGVGKGSVDYNAVRLASQSDLEASIASGGLAKAKSKNIKALLDMVYEENQQRRKEHLAAKSTGDVKAGPKGVEHETEEQKNAEIAVAEEDVLSLDHYYTLPTYDAIFTFVKYPGIGVKTAACVALFCMQRDCFAVDTHVFRLCKWLGWLPSDDKKVGRDTAFSHLEVRIPDDLKYDLHQLFIRHGKTCPRCRASTGETSAKWEDGCVIDHLVTRTGPRKEIPSPVKKATVKGEKSKKKNRTKDSEEEDEEEAEMPDLVDDEEDEADVTPEPNDEGDEYGSPVKATKKSEKAKTKATVQRKRNHEASPVKQKAKVTKVATKPKANTAARPTKSVTKTRSRKT